MADKQASLQDLFLNECRRSKANVTIFLVKGVKLTGQITWFDNFSLLLRRDGAVQLIYKHAISTISPALPLQLADLPRAGEGKGRQSLQDRFLDAAEKAQEAMTLFLMNGVVLPGEVAAHDQFAILLTRGGMGQLVYKHAISTLQPAGPLDLGSGDEP